MMTTGIIAKCVRRLVSSRRRFILGDRGATAIEFAVLAAPTILVIFSMVYSGLIALAVGVLDTHVEKVAYRVYEGRPLCSGVGSSEFPYDAACLKDRICEEGAIVIVPPATCKATARVDVRLLAENGNDNIPMMMLGGAINAAAFGSSTGITDGRVIMIRVALPFPNFTLMASSAPTIGLAGDRILLSSTAFRIRDQKTYARPTT